MAYHFVGTANGETVISLDSDDSIAFMDRMEEGAGYSAFIAQCIHAAKAYETAHGARVTGKVEKDGQNVYEL